MTPEHMREIEDRWPATRTGVENSEHCLEEAIQVHRWRCVAVELEQVVARVPPSVKKAFRQDYGSPGWHDEFLRPDLSAECSRFRDALFVFVEMHVQRRTACSWGQGTIERQDNLPLSVEPAAHQQNLPGMTVLQLQKVVHDL